MGEEIGRRTRRQRSGQTARRGQGLCRAGRGCVEFFV